MDFRDSINFGNRFLSVSCDIFLTDILSIGALLYPLFGNSQLLQDVMGKNGKFDIKLMKSINRLAGYAIWFLIVLLIFSTIRSIRGSARVKAQIEAEEAKVAKMQKDNEELQNRILMTQEEEYVEREIRNKLGLVKTGEVVVVLPDKEVLKQLAPPKSPDQESLPDPNWKKWLNLFL